MKLGNNEVAEATEFDGIGNETVSNEVTTIPTTGGFVKETTTNDVMKVTDIGGIENNTAANHDNLKNNKRRRESDDILYVVDTESTLDSLQIKLRKINESCGKISKLKLAELLEDLNLIKSQFQKVEKDWIFITGKYNEQSRVLDMLVKNINNTNDSKNKAKANKANKPKVPINVTNKIDKPGTASQQPRKCPEDKSHKIASEKESTLSNNAWQLVKSNKAKKRELRNNKISPNVAIIVKSNIENCEKSSDDVRKTLQKAVNPADGKVRIKTVKLLRDKGVLLILDKNEDPKVIIEDENLSKAGLSAHVKERNNPKMIIRNVCNDLTSEEVKNLAKTQNHNIEIECIGKTGIKDKDTVDWVIEVTPQYRKLIMSRRSLYIGWSSCPVSDYTRPTRCFKCQMYGHISKYCNEAEDTCSHCADKGHAFKACPNKDVSQKVCGNCKHWKRANINHSVNSSSCPGLELARKKIKTNTNYG